MRRLAPRLLHKDARKDFQAYGPTESKTLAWINHFSLVVMKLVTNLIIDISSNSDH